MHIISIIYILFKSTLNPQSDMIRIESTSDHYPFQSKFDKKYRNGYDHMKIVISDLIRLPRTEVLQFKPG
jgi:hypothetical protein